MNIWTCLTSIEQGLYCTHCPEARLAGEANVEDPEKDKSDGEVSGKDEADAEVIDCLSHLPRPAAPAHNSFLHEETLRHEAILGRPLEYVALTNRPNPACKTMVL